MGLRAKLGLCEHIWVDEGMITMRERNLLRASLDEPEWRITGYKSVQRCSKCGLVRSVTL